MLNTAVKKVLNLMRNLKLAHILVMFYWYHKTNKTRLLLSYRVYLLCRELSLKLLDTEARDQFFTALQDYLDEMEK